MDFKSFEFLRDYDARGSILFLADLTDDTDVAVIWGENSYHFCLRKKLYDQLDQREFHSHRFRKLTQMLVLICEDISGICVLIKKSAKKNKNRQNQVLTVSCYKEIEFRNLK